MEIRMESILENFDLTLTCLRKFAFGIELPLCIKVTATFTFRHSYGQILAILGQGEKNNCQMLGLERSAMTFTCDLETWFRVTAYP